MTTIRVLFLLSLISLVSCFHYEHTKYKVGTNILDLIPYNNNIYCYPVYARCGYPLDGPIHPVWPNPSWPTEAPKSLDAWGTHPTYGRNGHARVINNILFIGDDDSHYALSTNANDWSSYTVYPYTLRDLCFYSGEYWAVSFDADLHYSAIYSSRDAISWEQIFCLPYFHDLRLICDDKYMLAYNRGHIFMKYGTDFIDITGSLRNLGSKIIINSLLSSNGLLLLSCYSDGKLQLFISTDIYSWHLLDDNCFSEIPQGVFPIKFVSNSTGFLLLTHANVDQDNHILYFSKDGYSWQRVVAPTILNITALCSTDEHFFLGACWATLLMSDDGINWIFLHQDKPKECVLSKKVYNDWLNFYSW